MILYSIKHFEGYFDRYWNKLNKEKAIWLVMKFIQHFQILSISPSHHLRQTLHLPLTWLDHSESHYPCWFQWCYMMILHLHQCKYQQHHCVISSLMVLLMLVLVVVVVSCCHCYCFYCWHCPEVYLCYPDRLASMLLEGMQSTQNEWVTRFKLNKINACMFQGVYFSYFALKFELFYCNYYLGQVKL